MSDSPNIPKGSDFIVVSDAQLTAFARAVIVAYREEEAERPQPPALIATGQLVVDVRAFEAQVNGVVVPMKPREFKLLATLAKNLGHVLSREQLLELAWGEGANCDDRTVDVHILRIRRRLGEMQSTSSRRCRPSGTNCGGFR
jgi:DNA-binding response OmpR family regulator